MSVYIERYALDVIKCFGKVDDVINRMLDAATGEEFDVFDKPSAGPRSDSVRVNVNIVNEEYIALVESMPANSPRISLRRYVHWFIDNEMPYLLGWTVANEYKHTERDKVRKILKGINADCVKLRSLYSKLSDDVKVEQVDDVLNLINLLKEV